MKKQHFLLLLIAFVYVNANAQTSWVTKKLSTNLSVKFPSEPQLSTKNGLESYTVKEKDSTAFSASSIDLEQTARLDSAALASMKDNQGFADNLAKSMAAQKKSYTFGNVTIGKWKTYTSYTMSGIDSTTKSTLFVQMIFIGSKMYVLSCRIPDQLASKNKELFFSSVELIK